MKNGSAEKTKRNSSRKWKTNDSISSPIKDSLTIIIYVIFYNFCHELIETVEKEGVKMKVEVMQVENTS